MPGHSKTHGGFFAGNPYDGEYGRKEREKSVELVRPALMWGRVVRPFEDHYDEARIWVKFDVSGSDADDDKQKLGSRCVAVKQDDPLVDIMRKLQVQDIVLCVGRWKVYFPLPGAKNPNGKKRNQYQTFYPDMIIPLSFIQELARLQRSDNFKTLTADADESDAFESEYFE